MKVLLDASVPRPLRKFLAGHAVHTAQEMGWGQLKNGTLLGEAEAQLLFSPKSRIANGIPGMHPLGMTFTATVENGKVALPPEIKLPSGTKVRVETLENGQREESIGARLQALDGIASGLPVDMAQNHDHYLHGKTKCSPL